MARKFFSMNLQDLQHYLEIRQTRRRVLQQLVTLTGAGLALDACGSTPSTKTNLTPTPSGPGSIESIKHIVIACQENRSFDTYFGYYEKARNFGIPAGYSLPDGKGGKATPHKFHSYDTADIKHDWQTIHSEWDNGKMDGFYITDGASSLYSEHPPLNIVLGEKKMASVINAFIQSPLWTSSAFIMTYDEGVDISTTCRLLR